MKTWQSLVRPDFQPSHLALSVTRIAFFSICLIELCQLYYWRRLCFTVHDAIAVMGCAISVANVILPLAIVVQVSLILGLYTRASAVINFVALNIVVLTSDVNYHFDGVMTNVAFIFLFMPRPRVLAIDAWRDHDHSMANRAAPLPLPAAYLLFLAVELVYFDSLFFKYQSEVWLNGLAFWMPSALPHFATGMLPDWAEHPALMKGACYLALLVETLFPLVLFRGFRRPMFVLAFGLHLGVAVLFPIPLFGLGMCALLLFFVDWDGLLGTCNARATDQTNVLQPSMTRATPLRGFGLAVTMLCSQLLLIAQAPLLAQWPSLRTACNANRIVSRFMGLSRHGVYVDEHFAMQTPILRWQTTIDGQTVEIPTYDEKGYPRYPEISGRFWVLHLWVLRRDCITINELQTRWAWYLRRWFAHRGVELQPVDVYWKRVSSPAISDFEQDDRIEQQPWLHAGQIRLLDGGGSNESFETRFDCDFESYMREACKGGGDIDNRLSAKR